MTQAYLDALQLHRESLVRYQRRARAELRDSLSCPNSFVTAGQRAASVSCLLHRAGEANWMTGRVASVAPPIRKINLPPLTGSSVLTLALCERVDASLEFHRDEHEARRLVLLLTTGEVLP